MDAERLNAFEKKYWIVLLYSLYFLFSLLIWEPVITIQKPDGSYETYKYAMTFGERVIKSLVYILLLSVFLFLLTKIRIKWEWDILPERKWLIKILIATSLIFIFSQIIIFFVTNKLTGASISTFKYLLVPYKIFWESYEQKNMNLFSLSYWYVQFSWIFIWRFAKTWGPEMIQALFILISYILHNRAERSEREKWHAQTQVEDAQLREQQLQTQVEEKKHIISIALAKKNPRAIDLNGTSLFTSGKKKVQVYDKQYDKLFETRYDSLTQIEEKIENSGWSEGKFWRVADHLLINQDSIKAWVNDSGKNVIYVKGYLKSDKNEKKILDKELIWGIEVPDTQSEKYKENQQEMRKLFSA